MFEEHVNSGIIYFINKKFFGPAEMFIDEIPSVLAMATLAIVSPPLFNKVKRPNRTGTNTR